MADGARHMRDDAGAGAGRTPVRDARLAGWRLAALCLAVCVLVALACCVAQPPKYATPDDFVQDLFVRGEYLDTPSLLMPYSLVTFSAPVAALYRLLPWVPWYPLALLALTAVSFASVLATAVRSPLARPQRAFLAAALALCEAMCCVYLTYTVVAFLAMGAGLVLLLARAAFARPRGVAPADVAGLLLVLAGFSLRPESGLATLVVFCPFMAWVLLRNRNAGSLVRAALVLALMAGSWGAGMLAWHATPGWESFEQTFHAAQAVVDYPRLTLDAAREAVPGITQADLDMLYEFCFQDSDVFDLATFQALGSRVGGYGVGTMVGAIAERPAFTAFVAFLVVVVAAAAGLVCAARRLRAPARALALSVPAMLLADLLLVFLRARPKLHVIVPLFVIALFAVVVAALAPEGECEADRPVPSRARAVALGRVLPVAGVVAVACAAAFVELRYALPLARELDLDVTAATERYVAEHPATDVLFTHTQGVLLNDDALAFESWEYPDNAILLGGYEQYTAAWDAMLAARGLPSSDGFLENRLLGAGGVTVGTADQARMVAAYLSQHAGATVTCELVEELGVGNQSPESICVWSYAAA